MTGVRSAGPDAVAGPQGLRTASQSQREAPATKRARAGRTVAVGIPPAPERGVRWTCRFPRHRSAEVILVP